MTPRLGPPPGAAVATGAAEIDVVRPHGRLDVAGVEAVRRAIAAATGPVVVDLDECVVTGAAALGQLRAATNDSGRAVCFVSRRITCRVLLQRAGIAERVAVFERLEDALHARTREHAGAGYGWAPTRGALDAGAARSLR